LLLPARSFSSNHSVLLCRQLFDSVPHWAVQTDSEGSQPSCSLALLACACKHMSHMLPSACRGAHPLTLIGDWAWNPEGLLMNVLHATSMHIRHTANFLTQMDGACVKALPCAAHHCRYHAMRCRHCCCSTRPYAQLFVQRQVSHTEV
jgi:hypothetical protein